MNHSIDDRHGSSTPPPDRRGVDAAEGLAVIGLFPGEEEEPGCSRTARGPSSATLGTTGPGLELPPGDWQDPNRHRWLPLTIGLLRALSVARLGTAESMLIWAIVEAYSAAVQGKARGERWPGAVPLGLNMNELARRIAPGDESMRKQLYKARGDLLASGMIREVEGGLLIEPDVSRWSGRIPSKFRAYCSGGMTREGVGPSHPAVTSHPEVTSHSQATDQSPRSDCLVTPRGLTSHSSVTSHNRNARVGRIQKIEEEEKKSAPVPSIPSEGRANHTEPQGVAETPSTASAEVEGPDPASPEAIEWADLVRGLSPAVARFVESKRAEGVDPSWLKALVERKVKVEAGQALPDHRLIPLMTRILGDWKEAGACEFLTRDGRPKSGAANPLSDEQIAAIRDSVTSILSEITPPPKAAARGGDATPDPTEWFGEFFTAHMTRFPRHRWPAAESRELVELVKSWVLLLRERGVSEPRAVEGSRRLMGVQHFPADHLAELMKAIPPAREEYFQVDFDEPERRSASDLGMRRR